MRGISTIYTNTIREHLKPLFANWEPDHPIKLGDFGFLRKNKFIHVGNLGDKGISFASFYKNSNSHKRFSSDKKMSISFNGKGKVSATANASLNIKFNSKNSVFFNASGCNTKGIKNKASLGQQIMEKFDEGNWNKDHVVVTDIITSKSTLVVVSSSNNSEILLEANSNKF
jgi:hypothetical protein